MESIEAGNNEIAHVRGTDSRIADRRTQFWVISTRIW